MPAHCGFSRRFIPAHAGNTRTSTIGIVRCTVYPRSRGEHSRLRQERTTIYGLSPLTRGTLTSRRSLSLCNRFIPTHAGNTQVYYGRAVGFSVYPRSRGEHYPAAPRTPSSPGLSPLTRGTLFVILPKCRCHRFIPAHAGNTWRVSGDFKFQSVYPRSRGEHGGSGGGGFNAAGLSPLTRGTPQKRRPQRGHHRFIPAHAGNTYGALAAQHNTAVYPRSRGEHVCTVRCLALVHGLSPLTRGTLTDTHHSEQQGRFIPAHAGNTTHVVRDKNAESVYPRSRGEHPPRQPAIRNTCGLSPLTRGTRKAVIDAAKSRRFIPAHAGNTCR